MADYVYNNTYTVGDFKGIDESTSENVMNVGYSPKAFNMDTEKGDLMVGYGYSKHITTPVPDTGAVKRMYHWHTLARDMFVVACEDAIYAWSGTEWVKIYTFDSPVSSDNWDFEECKMPDRNGVSKDWLVIANGETQMIKWDGTLTASSAVLFGSGLWVHETTIASITYNGTKATGASYAESSGTGTFTLTMPAGWSYALDSLVAFKVPAAMGTLSVLKINISGTDYTMDYVPTWPTGEQVVVKLTGANTATEYLEDFGITSVTLTVAIPEEWKLRTKNAGIVLNEVNYPVSEVSEDRLTVTLAEVQDVELSVGDSANVRGEASEAPVNFIELYYSRMFTAGDPNAPSRLYWSQPPGDTKSIEDWSVDDASENTSGGYVEIGQTSSDPIVGLCALSNQLLIFKKSSIYRLLGDRPGNYRVVLVNKDIEEMVNTGRIAYGDTPFWITRAGLYYHTGSTAQLMYNARQVMNTLDKADISRCKAAECRDRLYFSMRLENGSTDDTLLVYDKTERTYLIRNGFEVIDICAYDGKLYMINSKRYVYVWDKSHTYDGEQINAEWDTPLTDMGEMTVIKATDGMYFRGEGGLVNLEYYIGDFRTIETYQMPEATGEIVSVPMTNQGRVFRLIVRNDNGSWFRILGSIGVHYERKQARL